MSEKSGFESNIPDSLPRISSSLESPIPFQIVIQNINSLLKGIYNKVAYRFPIFTTGAIVDVKDGTGKFHYFGLAASGHYIPAKIKNEGYNFQRLQDGFPVVAKGYFNLESPLNKPYILEIRLNVIELHHVFTEPPSIEKEPSAKKQMPETIKRIGLVTSANSEAIEDFYKGLKKAKLGLKIEIHGVNLLNPESISEGIRNADALSYDILVLTRGGGSDLYLFNDPRIVDAVRVCKTYTITGLGHTKNSTDCDRVSDLSVETPTSAGVYIKTLMGQRFFAGKNNTSPSQNENRSPTQAEGLWKSRLRGIALELLVFLRKQLVSVSRFFIGLAGKLLGVVLSIVFFGLVLLVFSLLVRGCAMGW